MSTYIPPEFANSAFNCPYCNAFAHQGWRKKIFNDISFSTCHNCEETTIWVNEKRIYPLTSSIPEPNQDMPKDVAELYYEARTISNYSPRATAALLRVGLEKLTEHLGETSGNLNTRIKNLKKQGLPEAVIKSLDIVRITANEGGAHAGVIDLSGEDNTEIVEKLFWLVNIIVEKTISEPKEIDRMFGSLPESKKDGINNRDNNPNT